MASLPALQIRLQWITTYVSLSRDIYIYINELYFFFIPSVVIWSEVLGVPQGKEFPESPPEDRVLWKALLIM